MTTSAHPSSQAFAPARLAGPATAGSPPSAAFRRVTVPALLVGAEAAGAVALLPSPRPAAAAAASSPFAAFELDETPPDAGSAPLPEPPEDPEVAAARKAAQEALAVARREAARIVAEAEECAAARDASAAEALARARAEEHEAFASAARELLARIEDEWQAARRRVEGQVATLALAVAAKILRRELDARPEAVVGMARAAMAQLTDGGRLRLRVSARDAGVVDERRALLVGALPPGASLEVAADESLAPGDVVVESEAGEIDARVDVQLETLARSLGATAAEAAGEGDGEEARAEADEPDQPDLPAAA